MTFFGYKRPDGRVGVRNKVLILPASVCASDTTRIIAQQVVGSVTFNNQQGCSQVASDQQLTMDVMAGYAANPNIYGTVVVSLGCENCQMDLVVKAIQERTNKPLKQVIIQEAGGTLKAVDLAVRYAKEMVEEASLLQKEEFPMSELIIGTECGGSDPTSGLAANPLIGQLSDLIVKEGGTSILSETTEFIGAEHLLARRAINKEVHDRIFEIVHRYEGVSERMGYHIHLTLDKSCMVRCDESKIDRVIGNLINNAINYTSKEDKQVFVTQRNLPQCVRIEVRDTGDGIEEDKIKLIFDKYYRSENHKREVVGTGLGLSIVKEILKMHNYNYGVNSKLGEGSTFWFEIRDIVPPDTAEQPESEIQ